MKASFLDNFLSFLLIGMLSTMFAELWLGFVFTTPGAPILLILMVFFYGSHVVFYFNLAVYFKRTYLTSLYWWGTLFGLYEAWVTTMIYYGYANVVGHHGEILGIAVYEYFANVFFWHPINSFILTLMALQILFPIKAKNKSQDLTIADTFISDNWKNKLFWFIYAVYAGGMITSCTYGFEANLATYYILFFSVLLLVYHLLYRRTRTSKISPLQLIIISKRGLIMLAGLLLVIYIWSFISKISGKPLYNPYAFLIVILTYLWSIYMINKSKENPMKGRFNSNNLKQTKKPLPPRILLFILILPLFVSFLLRLNPVLAWLWSVITVEAAMILGVSLLILFSLITLRK